MSIDTPNCLLLGRLTRQTLINAQGQAFVDQPGGNLLYAAAGAALWGAAPGLVARIGRDYPEGWLTEIAERGLNVGGIRRLPGEIDLRHFIAYRGIDQPLYENPIRHFAELGLPLPKQLLAYQPDRTAVTTLKARDAISLRGQDLPEAYAGAKTAHFCALDYLSHSTLPPILRERGAIQVSLAASNQYMQPEFWNELPTLVNGLSAFLASERQMQTLFSGHSQDLWEMAAFLGAQQCRAVIIDRGQKGYLVYLHEEGARYRIPPYPVQPKDITGQTDAFGGGFLAGLDAGAGILQAALQGAVAASMAVEGSGPFYALEGNPGLAPARLEALQQAVQPL